MTTAHRRTPAVCAGIGHPRVKQYLNVKSNRAPNRNGAIALEGLWALRAAAAASVAVEVVFVCPPLLRGDDGPALVGELVDRGTAVLEVSERVLRRMVDRDGPDGLAALAHLPSRRLRDVDVGPRTRLVVADGMDLAGNLGTIVRCSDGAGAAAVLVTDRRVRLSHPLVLKASMGTVLSLPVVDVGRDEALAWCRAHDVRVVAADPDAPLSYRAADYCGPVAVVVGSERHGLDRFWRDAADVVVSIPMLGVADSLNVGHAAALVLYEVLHQHRDDRHDRDDRDDRDDREKG